MHIQSKSALRSAVRMKINEIWYILLSPGLPFSGTSCLPDFCLVLDIICDTINYLLLCNDWDILCHQTKKWMTLIQAVYHYADSPTHIKIDKMISKDKWQAKGEISEEPIYIGWIINTRKILIYMPIHKYISWRGDVYYFLGRISISHKDLMSLIVELENSVTIVKMMGRFIHNTCSIYQKAEVAVPHSVKIQRRAKEDANLHKCFLQKCQKGISMNLLTFRKPTHTTIGDSCEHGLGAFRVYSGARWRWVIPENLCGHAHNNLLEFMNQVIQIWLDVMDGSISPQSCILAMGDNMASMGCLK